MQLSRYVVTCPPQLHVSASASSINRDIPANVPVSRYNLFDLDHGDWSVSPWPPTTTPKGCGGPSPILDRFVPTDHCISSWLSVCRALYDRIQPWCINKSSPSQTVLSTEGHVSLFTFCFHPTTVTMSGNLNRLDPAVYATWPTPDYENPERRTWMPIYAGVLQGASSLIVITRLWLRARNKAGPLGLDDVRVRTSYY